MPITINASIPMEFYDLSYASDLVQDNAQDDHQNIQNNKVSRPLINILIKILEDNQGINLNAFGNIGTLNMEISPGYRPWKWTRGERVNYEFDDPGGFAEAMVYYNETKDKRVDEVKASVMIIGSSELWSPKNKLIKDLEIFFEDNNFDVETKPDYIVPRTFGENMLT